MKHSRAALTLRLPSDLHRRLTKVAQEREMSLNHLLVTYLRIAWMHEHAGSPTAFAEAMAENRQEPSTSRSEIRRRNILAGKLMDEGLK